MKTTNRISLQVITQKIWLLAALFFFCFTGAFAQNIKYQERKLQVTEHNTNQMDEATVRQKMRADGLADPVIDKLIAQRKLWIKRGGNYNWSSAKNSNPVVNAPCNGLGVESGWGAWMWQNGTNSGQNPPTWNGSPAANPTSSPAGPGGPYYTITTGAGIDPNTPGPNAGDPTIPVVCPGFGNNSIKIGDDCGVNSNCNQLTYAMTVTPQDTAFVFAYAVVIEDAGHLPNEQPYCEIVIYDTNGQPIQCVPLIYTGGPNIPGFYGVNGNGCAYAGADQYKPWTLVGVNLSQYLGQTLNVVITNCDCIYGGHFCYSYWDFLCGTESLSAGCTGNQSTICGPIDPQIAYTYTWSLNGVPIPPPQGNQQCITITPQPGDTVTVAVGQPSGCDFHLLYVPASIQPNFNFTGHCGTYTFADSTTTSPANVTITGWSWSFPGGSPATSTTQSATVTYTTPGTYTVVLTIACSAGCSATVTHTITVNALPTAAFTSSPACLGNAITLTDGSVSPQGDPITQWSWTMPGGNPATSTTTNPTTIYSTAGTHTVTLTVTTQQGCTSNIPQQVIVYNPPVANFSGLGTGCAPLCVTNFTDASTSTDGNITSWVWSFPGGNPSTSTAQNPSPICYNNAGTYGAFLTVTTNYGCKDTITISPLITVHAWPKADFCISPDPAQQPATDPVFNFCNLWTPNPGVTNWVWNFGDGSSPDSVNITPTHSYSATATENDFYHYNVCLFVKTQFGCWDSICKTVEITPEFEFYIPNSFTPNGDSKNEFFFGKCRGVKEYNIWIFDRWGNMIWDCSKGDKNTNWDNQGQDGLASACQWDGIVVHGGADMSGNSGNVAQEDTYVWKVRLTDVFDKVHTYIGHVSIVK